MAKVLVVDDQELARVVISEVLEGAGHEVDTAGSGTEMMHKLLNKDYDVVTLDLKMPDMSGVRLARVVRRCVDRPPGMVIFSGLPEKDLARIADRVGVRHFLRKGCPTSELVDTVAIAANTPLSACPAPNGEFTPTGLCMPAPIEFELAA